MKRPFLGVTALLLSIAGLIGCGKSIDNKEAVRQGVVNYLAKRSDFLAMDVSVTSVAFRQDEATATVHFQAKGNNAPGAGMNMQYVLERKGTEWVVKGRAGSGAPHAGMPQGGGMPPGVPGASPGSIGAMPQTMPPGHPSVPPGGAPSGALPPGHPPVNPDASSGNSK